LSPLGLPLLFWILAPSKQLYPLLIGHLLHTYSGTQMPFFSVDYSFSNLQPGYG